MIACYSVSTDRTQLICVKKTLDTRMKKRNNKNNHSVEIERPTDPTEAKHNVLNKNKTALKHTGNK